MTEKKALPINVEIFHVLRERIVSKSHYTDGQLPSELLLMEEFNTSRHTIRAAMQRLVEEGLIERRRGAGTTIVERDAPKKAWVIAKLSPFGSEDYHPKLLATGTVLAGVHPEIATVLGLKFDKPMFTMTTILESEGQPYGVSTVFAPANYTETIPTQELNNDYMLNLIEKYSGLRAMHARQTTTAEIASPMIREALRLEENVPVLVIARSYYSGSGQPIEHSRLYVAGDSNPHVLNFYRDERGEVSPYLETLGG